MASDMTKMFVRKPRLLSDIRLTMTAMYLIIRDRHQKHMMLDVMKLRNQEEDTNVDGRINSRQASAKIVLNLSHCNLERDTMTCRHAEVRQRKVKLRDLIGSEFRKCIGETSLHTSQPTVKI